MTKEDLTSRLETLLAPLAESAGCELVAVEQAGGRGTPIIRVLLDREGGIDLDAICQANQWISDAFDSHEPFFGPYTLEVSSPGVDRPLVRLTDFDRFAGENATIKVKPAVEGHSTLVGTIQGVVGDSVVLVVEGNAVTVPYSSVLKARLKGVVSFDRDERSGA